LSAIERLAALESFADGSRRILLATDAASEGLNLHRTCRTVVNLELPWNPMRLEQRIGRVDRIGQTQTVHAFHLIGRGIGELALLDELRTRIAHAQSAIGAPDPLDGALGADGTEPMWSDEADVRAELLRLRLARILHSAAGSDDRPLIATARNRRTRARLGTRGLALWECTVEDACERIVSSRLIATSVDGAADRIDVRCPDVVAESASTWQHDTIEHARRFASAAIARTDAIAASIARDGESPVQPGLFDRRVQFADLAKRAAQQEALASQSERRAELDQRSALSAPAPRLRLVLVPPP
jgi:superfamily II DNA/RNA helicase